MTAVYSFDGSGTATAIGGYDRADIFSNSASISFEAFFRAADASTSQFLWDDGGTGAVNYAGRQTIHEGIVKRIVAGDGRP